MLSNMQPRYCAADTSVLLLPALEVNATPLLAVAVAFFGLLLLLLISSSAAAALMRPSPQ
jgi:hypothetical protein